jgi:hypothetical protein
MLFRRGWNAVQVQRFLGHSDPGFTLRRYVHLIRDDIPSPEFALPAVGAKPAQSDNSVTTRPPEIGRDRLPAEDAEIPVISRQSVGDSRAV